MRRTFRLPLLCISILSAASCVVVKHGEEMKGGAGLSEYRREKNQRSIDGLPSFDSVDDC